MNLAVTVKLKPNPEQASALLETMERFNAACTAVATVAFRERTASKVKLQRLVYYQIREQFGLSSQLTVRCIAKAAEAYKGDKTTRPSFRPRGAIAYDQRVLSWKGTQRVSILTLRGRKIVPVALGAYQAGRLKRVHGQADLLYQKGSFYLALAVDVPDAPAFRPDGWLGVDLGVVNVAADSDGAIYSGGHLNGLRMRHVRLRARLQSKGTRSASRLLKKRRLKERRFARNVNHVVSKKLVAQAKGTGRGIALEDLRGIRERITVRKAQRRVQYSWSFQQLRAFVEYKARLAGVPVALVPPRNTSRTCPACGHVAKENRPTRSSFHCVSCGFAGPADTIAAENIRRAAVIQPHAAGART